MTDPVQAQLVAARRKQILDAAATIFAEKGFHATTIKDVARAAGVADGTIYNYFENKPALLFGIFDLMRESILEAEDFTQVDQTNIRTLLKTYLQHPLKVLQADNFALFRVVASEIMVNQELRTLYAARILEPTLALAETHFQQWADRGLIKSTDIRLTLRIISGMVFGLIWARMMGDEYLETRWDDLPGFLADLLVDGMRSDGA